MWKFDTDLNKWVDSGDNLLLDSYNFYKQELSDLRFYSKCLSGATYLPVNSLDNIYDALSRWEPKSWYLQPVTSSPYSNSTVPPNNPVAISSTQSDDYYTKFLSEYGLTLKNLFTPSKLIRDSIDNYLYVDVASTEQIDINNIPDGFSIDGVRVLDGHKVLVKNNLSFVTLSSLTDPNTYFVSTYTVLQNNGATIDYSYFNEENGLYTFTGGSLVKDERLSIYDNCVRSSFIVKLGTMNVERQFHLERLLNGYFPTNGEPMYFSERKNWLLRNRVDYNNLFEINYYDVKKFPTQSYFYECITYSIPEREISIGEFGIILNTQNGISNIIQNKYKLNLRSISETSIYYWICGDDGTLLRVRKHDFLINRIEVDCMCPRKLVTTNLRSISFFNDQRGVAVGDLNTILVTSDGGVSWMRIRLADFDSYYYNKTIYTSLNTFFIAGNSGVFLEFIESIGGWGVNKRRISRFIDDDDEYLLVDNINDMRKFTVSSWNPTFSFTTQSTTSPKELIILTTDYNKIFIYDKSSTIPNFDFIYLDLADQDYGDINAITNISGSSSFIFSATNPDTGNPSIMQFNLDNYSPIGVGNSYSNTAVGPSASLVIDGVYLNNIFDYNGEKIYICGNDSLLKSATSSYNFELLDPTFESKLKSKLLFLDYDIGSKLNFFTDTGDYRLPNSLTFSSASFSSPGSISFQPIVISATAPSYLTQSQLSWIDYWRDRSKTFEFYSTTNPMTDSTVVLLSTTFSYTNLPTSLIISVSNISASASSILPLAPSILDDGSSRFSGIGLTALSAPTNIFELYMYDYLVIWRDNSNLVSVGDVMRFESSVVDANLVVNRIETLGGNTYHWMFTNFNESIINSIVSGTGSVILTHLNSYNNSTDFLDKFNLHPFSYAYKSIQSGSDIELVPEFNNLTAYYNLSTGVNFGGLSYTMSYTSGFLKFGYTPTYNILDYLESINEIGNPNPTFLSTKAFYSMPQYEGIPLGSLTTSTAYIDTNGLTYSSPAKSGNKIYFGTDLKLEWESFFINTFVDINIIGSVTYSNTKLLIIDKWYDPINDGYVIEFHKNLIDNPAFIGDSNILNGGSLDILSRRTLFEISEDLREMNLITRSQKQKTYIAGGTISQWSVDFSTYESELDFKPNTDSYAKIILSDSEVVSSLSGIIYTDYKNELALNITRLGEEFVIPISNTAQVGNSPNLYISCSQKHNLITGQGAVLEFNGGTGSSQEINQQYFGYQTVTVVNSFDFYVNIPYGNIPLVGNDSGFVKFTKQDPFLNYQPVDLIDVGVDKKGKVAIELSVDNLVLNGKIYSITNVDFSKLRFRLVDGLDIEILSTAYPWILEAEISEAVLGLNKDGIIWYKGTWECGRWFGGTWMSGAWVSGDWYNGIWNSLTVKDNYLSVDVDQKSSNLNSSTWFGGRWYDGIWNNGLWVDGRWYSGTWNDGLWYRGTWNDGTWNQGRFVGGIWVLGTWNSGVFNTDSEPAFWIDGKWYGGDFENGIWYNGLWEEKNTKARFGINAYNSRTATWHGGVWVSGSFYSRLNLNDQNMPDVSDVHKYSIWRTGTWISGDFYGGVAYNMDFKSGIWHGGILEDIQVIGMDSNSNYFVANGIFKFNIGDEITIIDNNEENIYSVYGSNSLPMRYKVLYTVEDTVNKWTNIYVDYNITTTVVPAINTGLRIVSRFKSVNWKSGIWTNGIYETGFWEGGIWYNGVFFGDWM